MFIKSNENSLSINSHFGSGSVPILYKNIKEKVGIKDKYPFNPVALEETLSVLEVIKSY
jgi:hypothetical protein